MRTFVLNIGRSHRFWNIALHDDSVTVSAGTTGRGLMTHGHFEGLPAPHARAIEEYNRLIKNKVAEGYIETTDQPLCGPYDSPTRRAMEKALGETPDDLATHMAYADHLMELGDPRGEFIQVQLALEDETLPSEQRNALRKRERTLLKKHERTWLGQMAGYWIDKMDEVATPYNYFEPQELTWRRGWIDTLLFKDGDPESAQAANSRRELLMLLRELRLEHCYEEVDGGPEELLKGGFFANIRVFHVGKDPGDESDECYYSSDMDVEPFLDKMPRLEELGLLARQANLNTLFARPMPTLRKLSVYHYDEYPLKILAKNKSLTSLTHLSIWPRGQANDGDGESYIKHDEFAALVRSTNLPALRHLKICLTDVGDEGMRVVVESGILKRLATLNLNGGTVTDAGARVLAECPDLRNLESLTLSGNYLTSEGIKELKATGVKLMVDGQHIERDREEARHLWDGDSE